MGESYMIQFTLTSFSTFIQSYQSPYCSQAQAWDLLQAIYNGSFCFQNPVFIDKSKDNSYLSFKIFQIALSQRGLFYQAMLKYNQFYSIFTFPHHSTFSTLVYLLVMPFVSVSLQECKLQTKQDYVFRSDISEVLKSGWLV